MMPLDYGHYVLLGCVAAMFGLTMLAYSVLLSERKEQKKTA